MNRKLLFLSLMFFWLALTWPIQVRVSYLQDLVVGIAVCVIAALIMGKDERVDARWLDPRRYFWAFIYVFVLAAYIVKANLEVAYRVIHPAMPIRPGIVRVKTQLRGDTARAVLSNSITLTPGTLAVDVLDDGTMFVHWIYVRTNEQDEATEQILGRFEWFIRRIFE